MEIVTPKEMQRLEQLAYADGSSEALFMEQAGREVAEAVASLVTHFRRQRRAILLCGKGNNAGDAYVAGVHLMRHYGYTVEAIQLSEIEGCSPLCQQHHDRFLKTGGNVFKGPPSDAKRLSATGVIIDGLFGTGFRGELKGDYGSIVHWANDSGVPIVSVDIPSGLNGETGEAVGPVIRATETVYLGLAKLGFFLRDGWRHVGKLRYGYFGLEARYTQQADSDYCLLTFKEAAPLLPPLVPDRHKYEAGYVVGVAGSPGMPGAALLASSGALRGGAGIVRLCHPDGMQAELSSAPYELIREPYTDATTLLDSLNKASAVFVGPGMGTSAEAADVLKAVLERVERPLVIDADALNLIAEGKLAPPKGAVLTPHRGEMHRLLGLSSKEALTEDFLAKCQAYADQHQVVIVLKGGPSFLILPDEKTHVVAHGHPGMATAGSGDVLTGVIAACLAQGLEPSAAAKLGTYVHALAGETAAEKKTGYSMTATDILDGLASAFRCLSSPS